MFCVAKIGLLFWVTETSKADADFRRFLPSVSPLGVFLLVPLHFRVFFVSDFLPITKATYCAISFTDAISRLEQISKQLSGNACFLVLETVPADQVRVVMF